MRRTNYSLILVAVVMGAGAGSARASTFDEQTGRLSLDGADYSVSFDDLGSLHSELGVLMFDAADGQLSEFEVSNLFVTDAEGLEGAGSLEMGGAVRQLTLHLDALETQFAGRRVELRIWQRPEGTALKIGISWIVFADPAEAQSVMLGHFRFLPTGRVTDDGWEEWSSGPVDFMAGGVVPPAYVELTDRQPKPDEGWATHRSDLRVRLDAFEILDLGPAEVPDATCTALNQADQCGSMGVCTMGRCMDAALTSGPVPQDPELKDDYLDRFLFEWRSFEGGRMPQAHMNVLAAAVEEARQTASPRGFWGHLKNGVAALRDGHGRAPSTAYSFGWEVGNLGVCVHLGEADLMPQTEALPFVWHVGASNPVADQLQVGDALVAIDGLTVNEWQNEMNFAFSGDPDSFDVVYAPNLLPVALLGGSTMTFARCDRSGPNPAPCSAGELEHIEIDFSAVLGDSVWNGEVPGWMRNDLGCDYRFGRAIDDPSVSNYSFAGYTDEGQIRTIIFNGMPNPYGSGEAWIDTFVEALDPPPDYLILDQRMGSGGSVASTDFMLGLMLTEDDYAYTEFVPVFERSLTDALWSELETCASNPYQEYCASYSQWVLHDYTGMQPQLRGVAGSTRIAVLNSRDASGNDFTSKLLTYRTAATRIFAPGPTHGAFGPVVSLATHLNELYPASIQHWDSLFFAMEGDSRGSFGTGTGVWPDELILQRQSDAVQGIDTTIEAAKAWLLQE